MEAANVVYENYERLSYIDGAIKLYSPLPLTQNELEYLYSTNDTISKDEEVELNYKLPNPKKLILPNELKEAIENINKLNDEIENISLDKSWNVVLKENSIYFKTDFGDFYISNFQQEYIDIVSEYIKKFEEINEWIKYICCDGKRKGAYKQRWLSFISNIEKVAKLREDFVSSYFSKQIKINNCELEKYRLIIPNLEKVLEKKGKISKLDILLNHDFNKVLSEIEVDGNKVSNLNDCRFILAYIELEEARKKLSKEWNELMMENGAPEFYELDKIEPEKIAEKWIHKIQYYLDWYDNDYEKLLESLKMSNIPYDIVMQTNPLDSDLTQVESILKSSRNTIPYIIEILNKKILINQYQNKIEETIAVMNENTLINSSICMKMKEALIARENEKYIEYYNRLERIFTKYEILEKRNNLLNRIEEVAPKWAKDIRNRNGIHGENIAPPNINEVWKCKQYAAILDEMTKESLPKLQNKTRQLSKMYREITEQYAEKCAWYNLLLRTEHNIDMKQALKGWEITVKKIGKGTGKNAARNKAKARELMAKCQEAVPCWIIPFNKAIESLKPGENEFDVVIIDEASQSDIATLSIAYMAKKMIVVGDDKQVSPMAVGVEIDKINALEKMYIKDKIPNSHLFSAKTSLYDIAATTFQPLMLKEHFRCVPEIIGFSNMLSYDFKIKPLRDNGSSKLNPAIINYRVEGKRIGKTNPTEAKTIVAYIKACMNIEEYKDKTFGVISLLGDEQVKLIQELIYRYIDLKDVEQRKILVGNAANFQGDERDVIFLSMVDSRNDIGPLPLQGYGVEDSNRKRYNVAVSRARDQIWVVNSLDSANDLKEGDIRKKLLDYAANPNAFANLEIEINKKSESVFEERVAKKLISEGYNIVQQYPVGAYRLDIVVMCGNKKVVIECDGEKYHSGEEKIREDMQRQAILERIGWEFIRIRGSQFFRSPETAMEHVFEQLERLEIYPETNITKEEKRESELLEIVKNEALKELDEINSNEKENVDTSDILFALNNNNNLKVDAKKSDNDINKDKLKKSKLDDIKKQSDNILTDLVADEKKQEDTNKIRNDYLLDERKKQSVINKKNSNSNVSKDLKDLSDELIQELIINSFEYVDCREKSGILWVLHNEQKNDILKNILKNYNYTYNLERRGSITTESKPAWRIMCKK